jgi:hypothetical protein
MVVICFGFRDLKIFGEKVGDERRYLDESNYHIIST